MIEELKPCPFCGGDGAFTELEDDGYAQAVCVCTASGPLRKGEAEAIAAWNTAYDPDKRLREALEPFALAADDLDDKHGDHSSIWEASAAMSITAGQLRKARDVFAALSHNGG